MKQDILNVILQLLGVKLIDLIQQGINLATLFCRCLGLIVVFTIENAVSLLQGIGSYFINTLRSIKIPYKFLTTIGRPVPILS